MYEPFKKIVIASHNPHKIRELSPTLMPFGIELLTPAHLNINAPEEPHLTFIENALLKARHCSAISMLPSLADDSGLCVPALNGAPGVNSSVYAQLTANLEANDQNNADQLLVAMEHLTAEQRKAYFVCCLVLVRHAQNPEPIICIGRWHGSITTAARGGNGFGYDPIFQPEGLTFTAGEMVTEQKNRVSHRAKALGSLIAQLGAD